MKPITDHWARKHLYGSLELCEIDPDDDTEVSCLWCHDTGVDPVDERPCPECELGVWNHATEMWDDARKGR